MHQCSNGSSSNNKETLTGFSLPPLAMCQKGEFSRPIVHHLQAQERKDRWSPSPFRARPQPRAVRVQVHPAADLIMSQYANLRVLLSVLLCRRISAVHPVLAGYPCRPKRKAGITGAWTIMSCRALRAGTTCSFSCTGSGFKIRIRVCHLRPLCYPWYIRATQAGLPCFLCRE